MLLSTYKESIAIRAIQVVIELMKSHFIIMFNSIPPLHTIGVCEMLFIVMCYSYVQSSSSYILPIRTSYVKHSSRMNKKEKPIFPFVNLTNYTPTIAIYS